MKRNKLFIVFNNNFFRPADNDRGPGGLWEILAAAGHARRDADHRGKSLLEQVRIQQVQDPVSHVESEVIL